MHSQNNIISDFLYPLFIRRILMCILIIFVACISKSFAQQEVTDSLLNVLTHHPREDTTKLDLLNDIVFSYYSYDPDKGLEMADKAITLAKKLKDTLRLAGSYANKGTNYWAKSEDSAATKMYMRALQLHKQLHDQRGMAIVYNGLGLIYFGQSNYPKAIAAHEKSLAILKRLKDSVRIAISYNNIGIDYQYLSDYPKALTYYFDALHIYEFMHNQPQRADVVDNIGIVYSDLKDYSKSLEYHFKALSLYRRIGNQRGLSNCLSNIGIVYDRTDSTDKAENYFQKALQISKSMGDKRHVASNYENLAELYYHINDYSKALDYLGMSLVMYNQLNDQNSIVICLNMFSNIYREAPANILLKHGIHPSNRYTKALTLLTTAKKLAQQTGSLERQSETWENLSKVYENQSNFRKALQAYKQYTVLKDSIYNNQKEKEITRNEIQFKYQQKEDKIRATQEKEQALATAAIRQQRIIRNAVIGGSVLLMLAALVIFIFYKRRRDAEDQKKDAEFKASVADTELKALRLQMNPHFIFNSLNSISDYMAKNDVQKADYYLVRFARVMRQILENSEKKEISLENDLKALELYMQLESMRLNNKFTYQIIVDNDIDRENTLVPPLILQPFVENSIWHGIAPKDGIGKIKIYIKKDGDMINCIVEDNGLGRKKITTVAAGQTNSAKKSMGLKITETRIDIINKIKKTKGSVELFDLSEGVRVEVKLPLELIF